MNYHTRTPEGFTLIETLVAITVMTLAILAPFAAIQQVVRATNLSRDQLVAAALAQEAIEYVRFVRYNNWLASDEASSGGGPHVPMRGLNGTNGPDCILDGGSSTSQRRCTVDARIAPYQGSTLRGVDDCDGANQQTCARLRKTDDGLYTQVQTEGDATPFTRYIYIRDRSLDGQGGYYEVNVVVTWNNHGTQTITLTENMYDWL